MVGRRFAYWLALTGSIVFFLAYREWLSWIILLSLLCLPWFALLISLPAMLQTKARVDCPRTVCLEEEVPLRWEAQCRIPLPPVRSRLLVQNSMNGQRQVLWDDVDLPTDHCGAWAVSLHKPRCCDYLGLFALPIRDPIGAVVLVRPQEQPLRNPPDMTRYQVSAWRPKAGGGFSENHELRLYRPGDNLRQVHWKLSAKTGKLMVRQPMEPLQNRMLLSLELRGTEEELDRKLGRLLWMSRYLLQCELPHNIQALTGKGMETFPIVLPEDVQQAVDSLLQTPCAAEGEAPDYMRAAWRYHIGGDEGEA